MANRSILYTIRAALQGGFVAVANEVQTLASFAGVVSGSSNVETALQRLDGTGVGSSIFTFTGSYAAQNSNISEWFGNRQQTRLRCTSNGGISPVTFTLPGATALGTAFDALVTAGLPETLRFVIEYTGPSTTFLSIIPRSGVGNPVIGGTSSIPVRTGIAATVEITRTSGTIGDYVFMSIGGIGDTGGGTLDSLKLISPTDQIWDASETGLLPDTGVVKGNAYKVVNAPSDGSGRFDEVMQNGDWVVWEGDTFTTWAQTPHDWFVLAAHEVRRITALEQDFLTDVQETAISDRNTVVRGANYADEAGEIRLKIYPTAGDYSAADLNTTGDVDEYTDASDQTGVLAVRLSGTQATLGNTLDELYAYVDDGNNNFTLLGNFTRDFSYQGDFGAESDYLLAGISYTANHVIRIYRGTLLERYNHPNLDINESNLSDSLQTKVNRSGASAGEQQQITTLENKVAALYPLTPDVNKLTDFAGIFDDEQTTQEVQITQGFSSLLDYRGSSTRYEQAGITYDDSEDDVVEYTGLTDGAFRLFGFKVTAPSNKVLLSLGTEASSIPLVDMTAAGNFRVNNYHLETTAGAVVTNELHHLSRVAGVEQLASGETNVSTFQITNYPTGASATSRSLQLGLDVYLNGIDSGGEHLQRLEIPSANTAQGRQTFDASIQLGPLHNNRTVNVTLSYVYRVSGDNLSIDIRLVTAPSDVTIVVKDVFTALNYTAASTRSRVDNWRILQDASGDYTFTGENELLLLGAPIVGGDANAMEFVPVARAADGTVDELNDVGLAIPHVGFGSIVIPDDIDFRSGLSDHYINHTELSHLVGRTNTQWVYGLALLASVTERQITEKMDFPNGIVLTGATNGTRVKLVIDDSVPAAIKLQLVEE